MLTLCIIGFIIWLLFLFLGYAIILAGSRADKYKTKQIKHRHATEALIVDKYPRELREKDYIS